MPSATPQLLAIGTPIMLQTEQIRAFLFEYLRKAIESSEQLQYGLVRRSVALIALEQCTNPQTNERALQTEIDTRLKEVIWDLILGRVLVPGNSNPSGSESGWPFLSITDHGRTVIVSQEPVPYDPDGYLARLQERTGGLSEAVEAYLAESLTTFRTNCTMASAVMLGAASEMVFLELCDAITQSFADATKQTAFEKETAPRRKMVARVKAVSNWLSQRGSQLPSEWHSDEQRSLITKLADLIRYARNDAGHPQSPPKKPSHQEMYALLMLFPDYCVKLYCLKRWLAENAGEIT